MEYTIKNKISYTMLEEKIQEAKELLWANGYLVIEMTDEMNKDADECDHMAENGEDKDCFGCSCSICVIK